MLEITKKSVAKRQRFLNCHSTVTFCTKDTNLSVVRRSVSSAPVVNYGVVEIERKPNKALPT